MHTIDTKELERTLRNLMQYTEGIVIVGRIHDDDTIAAILADKLDDRQLKLLLNVVQYAKGDPAGLPGHNLMMIISSLLDIMEVTPEIIKLAIDKRYVKGHRDEFPF